MTSPKPSRKPEAKAIAAPVGGGAGGVLVPFVLWLLGVYVWDAPSDAAHATTTIAAVPLPVSGLITFAIPAALALAASYWAPHTHRPDLADELPTVFQPVASADDERIATSLEHLDATVGQMQADLHNTGPIERVDHGFLSSVMDEAHD